MLPVNRAWRPDGMAVQRTTRVAELDACPQVVSGIGDRFYYRLKNKVMMVNFILMVKNTYLPSRARLFWSAHCSSLQVMAPEGQLFKAQACRGVHHYKDIVRDVEEVKFEIFFVILVMMRMVINTTIRFYGINVEMIIIRCWRWWRGDQLLSLVRWWWW